VRDRVDPVAEARVEVCVGEPRHSLALGELARLVPDELSVLLVQVDPRWVGAPEPERIDEPAIVLLAGDRERRTGAEQLDVARTDAGLLGELEQGALVRVVLLEVARDARPPSCVRPRGRRAPEEQNSAVRSFDEGGDDGGLAHPGGW